MINKEGFVSINFLKKEKFAGSMQGMRYRLSKAGEAPDLKIEVVIWPEPFAYTSTPEEKKKKTEFEFSVNGIEQSVDWLNEQYESQIELWNSVNPYKK